MEELYWPRFINRLKTSCCLVSWFSLLFKQILDDIVGLDQLYDPIDGYNGSSVQK